MRRRSVDYRIDGSEEGAPAFVVEDENDGGFGQVLRVVPVHALFLARLRHGSVQRNFVGDQLQLDVKKLADDWLLMILKQSFRLV